VKRSLAIMIAASLLASVAVAQDDEPQSFEVPFRVACADGRVVAVQVFAPVPGLITLPISPTACAANEKTEPKPRAAPAQKPASRSA
jgi:hypothetical protein